MSVTNVTTATFTTSAALYTVPTSSAGTYAYPRDLVVTNGGSVTSYFALGTSAGSAVTTASVAVPVGGSAIITGVGAPAGAVVYAVSSSGTAGTLTGSFTLGYSTGVTF